MRQVSLAVNVMNCLINTILTNVITWELITILDWGLQWNSVMHMVQQFLVPATHISDESVHIMTLWHVNSALLVVWQKFLHHEEGHVLISNVEDQVWTALVDSLRKLSFHHKVVDMIGLASEVLVDQVEWVPLVVGVLVHVSALTVGDKLLVWNHLQVEVQRWLETFLLHPVATIASELNLVAADLLELVHDLGSDQIVLARVCQDAHGLFGSAERTLRNLQIGRAHV